MANSPAPAPPPRSQRWYLGLFVVLFGATFLNYSQRFVFTQNTSKIQERFVDSHAAPTDSAAGDPAESANVENETELPRNVRAYSRAAARFSLGFAIGSLVFGVLADAVSVRWLYPLVVVIWSLAGWMSGWTETVGGLAASRFVLGLFEAGHWPCALRTTQRSFLPSSRTAANSILQSGASIGAVATPLLVLGLDRIDPELWRWAFFIVGGLGLPWAFAWLWLIREEDVRREVIQTDEVRGGDQQRHQPLAEVPLWKIFLSRRWWVLLFTVLCINTVWHFIRVWMVDWLENHHGYSHQFTSGFTAAYFLCTFFGALASGGLIAALARRGWNVHRARLLTFLLFALLTALIVPTAFLPRGPWLLAALLVVAFGSLGLFPVYYSLNQELSARHQGKVGGSLGFTTWLTLSFFHEWVGELIRVNPENRAMIFCAVGIAPLLAWGVLRTCWGTRTSPDLEQSPAKT